MRRPLLVGLTGVALVLAALLLFALLIRPATPRAQAFKRAGAAGLALDLSETRSPKTAKDDARPILEGALAVVENNGSSQRVHALLLEAAGKPHLSWDFKSGEPYSETAKAEARLFQVFNSARGISSRKLKAGQHREALELLATIDQLGWKLLQNPGKHPQTIGASIIRSNVAAWADALSHPLSDENLAFAAEKTKKATEYRMSMRLFLAEELAVYRQFLQTRITSMLKGAHKPSLKEVETLRDSEIVFAESLAKSVERLGDKDRDFEAWRGAFEPESKLLLDPKHPSFKYLEAFWPNASLMTDMQTQIWVESLLLDCAAQMLLEARLEGVDLSKTKALANSQDPISGGQPFQFRGHETGFVLVSPDVGLMPSGMASRVIKLEVQFKD